MNLLIGLGYFLLLGFVQCNALVDYNMFGESVRVG